MHVQVDGADSDNDDVSSLNSEFFKIGGLTNRLSGLSGMQRDSDDSIEMEARSEFSEEEKPVRSIEVQTDPYSPSPPGKAVSKGIETDISFNPNNLSQTQQLLQSLLLEERRIMAEAEDEHRNKLRSIIKQRKKTDRTLMAYNDSEEDRQSASESDESS